MQRYGHSSQLTVKETSSVLQLVAHSKGRKVERNCWSLKNEREYLTVSQRDISIHTRHHPSPLLTSL